eukprot:gnl/MRDRNA2_/MRDRNA2_100832_c0_seq1.p1 gnl/MRDRNA2_/MRDRNA2_100832_c0~~gnl/MRDRNA2_/MRDRNA2_100832_c0_seq1.p1  ORF type:complete len:841 (+),score=109.40 gnl/MRDRNA2_/MRDRNA2_100832_c0_seq1:66-2525(+)
MSDALHGVSTPPCYRLGDAGPQRTSLGPTKAIELRSHLPQMISKDSQSFHPCNVVCMSNVSSASPCQIVTRPGLSYPPLVAGPQILPNGSVCMPGRSATPMTATRTAVPQLPVQGSQGPLQHCQPLQESQAYAVEPDAIVSPAAPGCTMMETRKDSSPKEYVRAANVGVPAALEQAELLDHRSSAARAIEKQRNIERRVAARKQASKTSRSKARCQAQPKPRGLQSMQKQRSISKVDPQAQHQPLRLCSMQSQNSICFETDPQAQHNPVRLQSMQSQNSASSEIDPHKTLSLSLQSTVCSTGPEENSACSLAHSDFVHPGLQNDQNSASPPRNVHDTITPSLSSSSVHTLNTAVTQTTWGNLLGGPHHLPASASSPILIPDSRSSINSPIRSSLPHGLKMILNTEHYHSSEILQDRLNSPDARQRSESPIRVPARSWSPSFFVSLSPPVTTRNHPTPASAYEVASSCTRGVAEHCVAEHARQHQHSPVSPSGSQHRQDSPVSSSCRVPPNNVRDDGGNQMGLQTHTRSKSDDTKQRGRPLMRCHSLYEDAVHRKVRREHSRRKVEQQERMVLSAMQSAVKMSMQGPSEESRPHLETLADFVSRTEATRSEGAEAQMYEQRCLERAEDIVRSKSAKSFEPASSSGHPCEGQGNVTETPLAQRRSGLPHQNELAKSYLQDAMRKLCDTVQWSEMRRLVEYMCESGGQEYIKSRAELLVSEGFASEEHATQQIVTLLLAETKSRIKKRALEALERNRDALEAALDIDPKLPLGIRDELLLKDLVPTSSPVFSTGAGTSQTAVRSTMGLPTSGPHCKRPGCNE